MRTVVTAGPTISADQIRDALPDAEVVAPIQFGDAERYKLRAGDRLAIIDGLFWQVPSVRHKELLRLLDAGVEVHGASSMGALRAAELCGFGMVGHGEIFTAYRDGALIADDEVGMVHGYACDGYPVFVDALVNIRATLRVAATAGQASGAEVDALLDAAQTLCYTARSVEKIAEVAGFPADRGRELSAWCRANRVDAKHGDAMTMLDALTAGPRPVTRPGVPATLWTHGWGAHPTLTTCPEAVTDRQVLEFRLLVDDQAPTWWHRIALEQFAIWAGEVNPERLDLTRLEQVAETYADRLGVIHASAGFPAHVTAALCRETELRSSRQQLTALVLARTLLVDPAVPADGWALRRFRGGADYGQWKIRAAAAAAATTALAAAHPHLDLTNPRPQQLAGLVSRWWGEPADEIGRLRRGFFSAEQLLAAAAPFLAGLLDGQPATGCDTVRTERPGSPP